MSQIKKPVARTQLGTTAYQLLRLMRPEQWIKNSFVLAPLVFAGELFHVDSRWNALVATALFCIASSTTYIVNDLADIEADRAHPKKSKTRPLASGVVTIPQAITLLVILYAILVFHALSFTNLMTVIGAYLALNIAYTAILKHQPVLDIFSIAAGFVLRVLAGSVALSVPLSSWMFATTFCLALFLAAIKRRQELLHTSGSGRKVLEKYTVSLVDRYAEMSATGALIFYSLYVMSSHHAMVLTIPFVLFGLFRYWFVVEALDGGESPTDALLKDWQLLATVVGWVLCVIWVYWPKAGA